MRKHTKRKRHYALVNPIELAISGACITTEADLDKLRMAELSSIESFATGAATQSDFRALADMLNVCQTMADKGHGTEALAACEACDIALCGAKGRYDITGKLGMTDQGIQALREVYAWHDAQRTAIDRSTYERYIQHTANRIRSRHFSLKTL